MTAGRDRGRPDEEAVTTSQACDYDPDEPDATDYVDLMRRSLAVQQARRHLSVVPATLTTSTTRKDFTNSPRRATR